jgi:lipoprotein signal peptidase
MVGLVALDQLTKAILVKSVAPESVTVILDSDLVSHPQQGAIFGMFNRSE